MAVSLPLSLSLFDWEKFSTKKGAIKLHAVLDYNPGLPSYAVIMDGKTHDVKAAQQTVFPAESVLVVDRAYLDQYLVLISNQFTWTADTISQLFKARWDLEVFFKHLKQLFRVKTFVGTSENAVRIQM